MWIAIHNHVAEAIDQNMTTLGDIQSAMQEADFSLAMLAKEELRLIFHRANELDTQLRRLMMNIAPAVEKERENNKP